MYLSKKRLTLLGVLLLALSACSEPATQTDPMTDKLESLIESYVEKRDFSGTILVARGSDILIESSYGNADIAWSVPNTPDTRYRIGSLTKPIIATLIMDLVEDDILSLDGTLGSYLPDHYANTPAEAITVKQLLNHTSGLKDIPQNSLDPWWETTARLSYAPEELASDLIPPKLIEDPGTEWRYNNAAFILLGLIIESVTEQSYGEVLQTRIFGPAGMTDSGVFSEDVVIDRLARGYALLPTGELGQPVRVDASVLFSAAGIYSTAQDLYKFDQALYSADIVEAETIAEMHTQQTNIPYGLGWGLEEFPKPDSETTLKLASHTGSIPGYQSYYLRSEDTKDVVIVLNNTNNGSAVTGLGRSLMANLNGIPTPPVKRRLEDYLLPIAHKDGTAAMVSAYEGLGERRSEYDMRERTLNRLGYKLIQQLKREADAVAIFEIMVKEYPTSANAHDSLGEAYVIIGETDRAIQSYEQALELNPDMPSATAALKTLKAQESTEAP